jgi:hypothetical protein
MKGSVFAYVILRTTTDTKRFNTTLQANSGLSHPSIEARTRRTDPADGVHIHLERVIRGEDEQIIGPIVPLDNDSDDHSKHSRRKETSYV